MHADCVYSIRRHFMSIKDFMASAKMYQISFVTFNPNLTEILKRSVTRVPLIFFFFFFPGNDLQQDLASLHLQHVYGRDDPGTDQ